MRIPGKIPRLLQEIAVGRLDDRYARLIAPINKCEVLILDDLLISPLTREKPTGTPGDCRRTL